MHRRDPSLQATTDCVHKWRNWKVAPVQSEVRAGKDRGGTAQNQGNDKKSVYLNDFSVNFELSTEQWI